MTVVAEATIRIAAGWGTIATDRTTDTTRTVGTTVAMAVVAAEEEAEGTTTMDDHIGTTVRAGVTTAGCWMGTIRGTRTTGTRNIRGTISREVVLDRNWM